MDKYLKDFEVEHKNPSDEALRRWRSGVTIFKNRRRRFRMVADLNKRSEAEKEKLKIQEKIRIALYVQRAALQYIDATVRAELNSFDEPRVVDYGIDPNELASVAPGHSIKAGTQAEYEPSDEPRQGHFGIDPNELASIACGHSIKAAALAEYEPFDEPRLLHFGIDPNELASIARGHSIKGLKYKEGVEGIASKVSISLNEGVRESDLSIRQKIYGVNRYTEKPPRTFLMFVWEAFQDLTLITLMVCAVVSIGIGLTTEGWPEGLYDGLGIILSIFLVVIVSAISDYKQSLQFRDLDKEKKNYFIQVTRDGRRQKVSLYDLVVGDIVHLSIGDQVPADGIFISGHSLLIDESSLTGESEPVNMHEEKPFLLAGTKVYDGSGKMLVTAVGMRTEWGKLMETLNEGGEDETPLQVKLNGVATITGKIGLFFAVGTFIVLTGRFLVEKAIHNEITDWSSTDALTLIDYFAVAVAIIVVAVAEGLPLAVTLSLAFTLKKLMNDKALVRNLSACETMGSANCICTDKTAILTTNHMVVDKIWICNTITKIEGNKNQDIIQSKLSESLLNITLQAIFQNTGSEVVKDKDGKNTILGTPTESALLEFGLLLGGKVEAQGQDFIDRKMSVLVTPPEGGKKVFCKGASEMVLSMCDKVVADDGKPVPISEEQVRNITDVINGFASEALRTLCLAFKDLDDSSDEKSNPDNGYTLIAVVGIKDSVRPGVKEAVQTCLEAGITVCMVTGDNISTAKAVARECGILTSDGETIEGPVFHSMSPDEMKRIIPKLQVMARSFPSDKHTLVTQLRNTFGEVVAVTGDGSNDAPALHESDIGLAMGIAGTEVAKENADVIILDDNFSTIVNVAKWGRSVYINIQKFVQFQLTVIIVALVINSVSACISGSAPLTAVQLLWVNMIMDTLGSLALVTEPPHDGLMKRPPVGRGENFVTKVMWRNTIGQSIYQLIILGLLIFNGKQLLGLSGSDATDVINTVIFNSFVLCQVFNEINSREMENINVFRGIFGSWMFIGILVITVAFQVIIVEFLGAFASTVPLSWQMWLLCILIGAVSMPVAVIIKYIPVKMDTVKPPCHDGYEPLPTGPEMF